MYQKYNEPQTQKKSCLQYYISFTSYINLLVSIAALIFAIYKGAYKKETWNSNITWQKSFLAATIVGGVFLLIISTIGIIGGRKRNPCCIFLFQIFSMVLALVFLFVGFFFMSVTNNNIINIKDDKCISTKEEFKIFTESEQAYNLAQSMLCSATCKCYVLDTNVDLINKLKSFNKQYSVDPKDKTLAIRVQNCQEYDKLPSSSPLKLQSEWLKYLEESFNCIGMCKQPKDFQPSIYYFSDINRGAPNNQSCREKFIDFIQSYGKIVYGIGIGVGFYLLFNAFLSCFLCCRQSPENQNKSYYQRMSQY